VDVTVGVGGHQHELVLVSVGGNNRFLLKLARIGLEFTDHHHTSLLYYCIRSQRGSSNVLMRVGVLHFGDSFERIYHLDY
jgi:hypothetical protein